MSYTLFYIRYKLMVKGMREKKEIACQDILPHTILPCTSHYEGYRPQTLNGLAFAVSYMLNCTHLADQTSCFSRRIPGLATLVYPLPVQTLPVCPPPCHHAVAHISSFVSTIETQFQDLSQDPVSHEASPELSSQMCSLGHLPGTHHSHVVLCNCSWCGWLFSMAAHSLLKPENVSYINFSLYFPWHL